MEVVTTHVNADFDCLGAMVAAARLYPGALLALPGSQEKGVRDFVAQHPDYLPPLTRAKDIPLEQITRLIIVDCQDPGRIGPFGEILGRSGLEVHVYDHHPTTADSIVPSGGVIRPCGAVSSLMTTLLVERGLTLTPHEATLMMLGVYEDTGRLLFQPTTREDYMAAAWLLEQGARLNIVSDFLTQELNRQQVGLLNTLLKNLKTTDINGIRVSLAHAACDSYVPDIAGLAHILRDMENLDVLFLVVAMEQRVYLVARSRVAEVNAGEVMRRFHGGGHPSAASATVHDQSLAQVLERLESLLRVAVNPRSAARDIMSTPVKTMPAGMTIDEARELLTRYNCNAMPVLAPNGRMTGIISRKIVEKALYHGLGRSLASDFMHTEFLRAHPTTPISDIQTYMVEGNRRFVPVFSGEGLVGAVTRTDLLRHMYGGGREAEAMYDMGALAPPPKSRSIAGIIGRRLSPATIALLRDLGRTADGLGLSAYAVGGFVRDLLLGQENLDLDVTVEGDGIFFAERFAATCACRVRSHPAFGTAVVILPDGSKVDVASTRLEYYESPGVLPTVERSSLHHDLYRRDFTINTLAFCINSDRFGLLTDYFGGQQDLQERTVRVLHNLSFVEDPTRVFRAIRFEQRLGFHVAPHTENLIRNAVRLNVLEKVGGSRLLNELIQILREREPAGSVGRMATLGLLPSLHPHLRLSPEVERVIHETAQVLAWFRLLYLEDLCEQWQVYFLALCDRLKHDEFSEACSRLNVPGRVLARVFSHRRRALGLLDGLQRRIKRGPPLRNSEIDDCFHDLPLELLLHLAARTPSETVRRCITLYITKLRQIRCDLNGSDLLALGVPPGPRLGEILTRLRYARLDGRVSNREEELALAQELIAANRRDTVA